MKNAYLKYIATQMKEARKRLGLTQEQAANLLKMNYRHLQKIEAGLSDLKSSTILTFQDQLGFWDSFLFTGKVESFVSIQNFKFSSLITDAKGKIIYSNKAWKSFAKENSMKKDFLKSANYFDVCRKSSKENLVAKQFLKKIAKLKVGDSFEIRYACHAPWEKRWFVEYVECISFYSKKHFFIVHMPLMNQGHTSTKSKSKA